METSLLKIINHYGIFNQLRKINEECYELIEAIRDYEYQKEACMNNHCTELHVKKCKKHVAEELGDVMNVLEEIRLHYEISKEEVEENRKPKIERQLERIEKGE